MQRRPVGPIPFESNFFFNFFLSAIRHIVSPATAPTTTAMDSGMMSTHSSIALAQGVRQLYDAVCLTDWEMRAVYTTNHALWARLMAERAHHQEWVACVEAVASRMREDDPEREGLLFALRRERDDTVIPETADAETGMAEARPSCSTQTDDSYAGVERALRGVRFTGEVVDLLSAQASAAQSAVAAMARGFSEKLADWQGLVAAEMQRRERAWADERAVLNGRIVVLNDEIFALKDERVALTQRLGKETRRADMLKEAADMMQRKANLVDSLTARVRGLRLDVEALTGQLGAATGQLGVVTTQLDTPTDDEAMATIQTLKAELAAKSRTLEDMGLLMKGVTDKAKKADALEARMRSIDQTAETTRREVGAMRELITTMSKRMKERLRVVEQDHSNKVRFMEADRAALLEAFQMETAEMRHRLHHLEAFLANIRSIVPVGGRPDEYSETNRVRIRQLVEEHDIATGCNPAETRRDKPSSAGRGGRACEPPVVVVLPPATGRTFVFPSDETEARIARRDYEVSECLRRNAEEAVSSGEVVAKSLWDILGRNPKVMQIGEDNDITLHDLSKAGKEDLCRAVSLLTMILSSTFEYCAALSTATERLTGLVRSAAMTHTVVMLKMLMAWTGPDPDDVRQLFKALTAFMKENKGVIDVHVAKRINTMLQEHGVKGEGETGRVYADVAARDVSWMC